MSDYTIRSLNREDRQWIAHFLDSRWGSTQIVSRGRAIYGHLLPGFVAEREVEGETKAIGLLTYNVEGDELEIMTLDSLEEKQGIGSALVSALKEFAKESGKKRLWLITTNDNLAALRFWQKRDFSLVAVHRNAIVEARRLKPQIPLVGLEGIPIRDEIELEMTL